MLGRFALAGILFAVSCLGFAAPASADGTLGVTYFTLPENHPDVGHGIDGVVIKGLVAAKLGPHGFPVATTFARTKGAPSSGEITDLDSDGEIMWWSTSSAHGVRVDSSGTAKLPLDMESMFPTGHTDDTHGFRTAHFRGQFTASSQPKNVLQLGSDDDAWVFVDGKLAVDNGGVKPKQFVPYSLPHIGPGSHTIDIFYADRHGSGASVQMSSAFPLTGTGVGGGAIPLPAHAARVTPSLTAEQMREQLAKTGRFSLRDIHFAFNKTDISHDSARVLGEVGKLLTSDATLRLRIEGHTDNVGSADYNNDLSARRAAAVKSYLVANAHVDPSRLTTAGYGFSQSVATNDNAKGRALNRRVDFVKI